MNTKSDEFCLTRAVITLRVTMLCFVWSALALFFAISGMAPAAEADMFDLPDDTVRLCISLRVLSERVSKALTEKSPLSEEIQHLYGIGYLEGFIIDQTGKKDIILVGRKSPKHPSLHLDDLIVVDHYILQQLLHPVFLEIHLNRYIV